MRVLVTGGAGYIDSHMVVTLRRAGRGVKHFVLSSTAAVYGDPRSVPIDEDHPTAPVNPYGVTKVGTEWMLAAYARAYGLRHAALPYFNAAVADPEAGLGERHTTETHLVPIVLLAALGKRDKVAFEAIGRGCTSLRSVAVTGLRPLRGLRPVPVESLALVSVVGA